MMIVAREKEGHFEGRKGYFPSLVATVCYYISDFSFANSFFSLREIEHLFFLQGVSMAQPPLIGKWITGRLYPIVLKLLFIIFLIISVILALEYFSSGMDELIGPFASPIMLNNITRSKWFFCL